MKMEIFQQTKQKPSKAIFKLKPGKHETEINVCLVDINGDTLAIICQLRTPHRNDSPTPHKDDTEVQLSIPNKINAGLGIKIDNYGRIKHHSLSVNRNPGHGDTFF